MTTTRDMTKKEFDAACQRYGFRPTGFLGYYEMLDGKVSVSALNAGKRRRDQLAYLIRMRDKHEKRLEANPEKSFGVWCPCGANRHVTAESQSAAAMKLVEHCGWSYVRVAKDGDLEGVCGECRELMDEEGE